MASEERRPRLHIPGLVEDALSSIGLSPVAVNAAGEAVGVDVAVEILVLAPFA